MKKLPCALTLLLVLLLLASCAPNDIPRPADTIGSARGYDDWARAVGYSSGVLVDDGAEGILQDRFRTLPGSAGYDSGVIVIGDSRCCQLSVYQQRAGADAFAVFAVWGGHYTGREPFIPTESFYDDVEACFREQIRARGSSRLFFFATVNDYDPEGPNSENISAAASCAERLASMSFEYEGVLYSPELFVIGIEGCGSDGVRYGLEPAFFNRGIDEYNAALETALAGTCSHYTTVPEITSGKTGFIDDGLHYSDDTLAVLIDYILAGSRRQDG